jgi:hypothetical protein
MRLRLARRALADAKRKKIWWHLGCAGGPGPKLQPSSSWPLLANDDINSRGATGSGTRCYAFDGWPDRSRSPE